MKNWIGRGRTSRPLEEFLDWSVTLRTLRKKWLEVPLDNYGRWKTTDLLSMSDAVLLEMWTKTRESSTTGDGFGIRGWYHSLYAESMRGKKVLDVGCGFGLDSITFAQRGAKLTFVDLLPSNVDVVRRLCRILGLHNAEFLVLEDLGTLEELGSDYDVIMAMGSLHCAPFEAVRSEVQGLVQHLKIGGRWLQLAYPRIRWEREGSPPFDKWGEMTDGPGTPWMEWYDLEKLLRLLAPHRFDAVLYHEFHEGDFNWFDLLYRGPDRAG